VVFCHARRAADLPRWTLRSTRGAIELGVAADWLGHHPLTQHLLEEEAAQWEKVGIRFALRAL
jgi:hypothetical protein